MSDLRRDLTPQQIDDLVAGGDWFPFVEVWSTMTARELFENLVASPYGGSVEDMPKVRVDFTPRDLKFTIPPRFLKAFPTFRDQRGVSYALLTHDVDNKDLRTMNAVGDFYMEDIRLASSKRRFMEKKPMDMWDEDREKIVELAREKFGRDSTGPYEIRNTVFKYSHESNPFRPSTALAVYSILNAKSILDMSAGWGDRLLGAMAWAKRSGKPIRYQGYDPFSDLQDRYKAMIEDFGGCVSGSQFTVTCSPFEDAEVEENGFDVAFTSPPYFDFEEYGLSDSDSDRSGQSTVRYAGEKEWVEGFLKPMMLKASGSLRRGGYLAMSIEGPFMYGVLEHEASIFTGPSRMQYMGIIGYRSDEPKDRIVHPIFVWRRVA